ncbi:MAG: hypothetical protein J6Y00_01730 [Paludibacteraceae bacterium]|nr:hypothetical protein [Paludibacteraceae bacterium]
MQALDQLEISVRQLIEEQDKLHRQLTELQDQNEAMRSELVRTHGEMNDLQQRYRALLTAHQMTGGTEGDRQRAKDQLALIIGQVNRAMEALKS